MISILKYGHFGYHIRDPAKGGTLPGEKLFCTYRAVPSDRAVSAFKLDKSTLLAVMTANNENHFFFESNFLVKII